MGAEMLGYVTEYGYGFMYEGVEMACYVADQALTKVHCVVRETLQHLICEYRTPAEGHFTGCVPEGAMSIDNRHTF